MCVRERMRVCMFVPVCVCVCACVCLYVCTSCVLVTGQEATHIDCREREREGGREIVCTYTRT